MKYIRTKDGRIGEFYQDQSFTITCSLGCIAHKNILNYADTIKELCDEFVMISGGKHKLDIGCHSYGDKKIQIYGAIWTDKGLIYVAKMNEKGELELL